MNGTFPQGDRTPESFTPATQDTRATGRDLARRALYPSLLMVRNIMLRRRYQSSRFSPDRWLLGQRGNDYRSHRRRVDKLMGVEGRSVMVAGCGTGNDIPSWVRLKPAHLLATDWFDYERAWRVLGEEMERREPDVAIDFMQVNLEKMPEVADQSLDIVASDAVFEHLKDLSSVLAEFHRILRPSGIVYATFGPLWFGFGGDHVSGYDGLLNGYNHLLLDEADWKKSLEGLGEFDHSEHDGRTWIASDLFSRLRPIEYLEALEQIGFERVFVQAIVDPRAIRCLKDPELGKRLLDNNDVLDLVVSGMTVIYRKRD